MTTTPPPSGAPQAPPQTSRVAAILLVVSIAAAASAAASVRFLPRKKATGVLGSRNRTKDDRESAGGGTEGGRQRRPRNMFDCDALPDEECTYFRPVAFFESDDGAGRAYLNVTAPWHRRRDGLPKETNYLRLHRTASKLSSPTFALVPRELVYVHIHKNGGTTAHDAMHQFKKAHQSEYNLDAYYYRKNRRMNLGKLRAITSQIMGQVAQKQRRGDLDAFAFTFLRDPVQKFLSGIGQVMNLKHARIQPCSGLRGSKLADCALSFLAERGLAYNIHLKPQVIELYDCAGGTDVAVSLLDMGSIGSFVQEGCLGLDTVLHDRSVTKKFFPTGDGVDPVSLLDDSMIRKVCQLYEVDVVFFRSIGREVPMCDPYIANLAKR